MDKNQIKLISRVPTKTKSRIVEIIKADPKLKSTLDRLSKGVGSEEDVKIFNNMRVKADSSIATGRPVDVKDVKEGSWWSKQKKGTKIAIIGGGALAIGLGVFAFIKARKKK
jgi:hypothetical protein